MDVIIEDERKRMEMEIVRLNGEAMSSLYASQPGRTRNALLRARTLLDSKCLCGDRTRLGELFCLTMNNQACYYKNQGKLNVALAFLSKALSEADKCGLNHGTEHACTLLNVCAILSTLEKYFRYKKPDRHHKALEYATKAVEVLTSTSCPVEASANIPAGEMTGEAKTCGEDAEYRYATLGIAYYNMGAELEFLRLYEDAVRAYEQGAEKLRGNIRQTHPVLRNLMQSCAKAKEKQMQLTIFHKDRALLRASHATKLLYAARPVIKDSDVLMSNKMKSEETFASTTLMGKLKRPVTAIRSHDSDTF